jgi:hypothetical protein
MFFRQFAEIAKMVLRRQRQIKPYHIMMLWRRLGVKLLEALSFKRI